MDKQLSHHVALDNGITSLDDIITIYSCLPSDPDLSNIYCQPSAEETPTPDLQHGNHKIQMNKVITLKKKMLQAT